MREAPQEQTSETMAEPTAVMERLGWQIATRDDQAVARALHAGEEIDAMYELSEAGLLDEFFVFLEQIDMMEVIEGLNLPNVRRVLVPTVQFVLLYLVKVLFGVESMNALPKLLFSHVGVMKLVGFNATHIEHGMTKRGDSQRKTRPKQGPISPQCLANNICKLSREQMEQLFNEMVRCVVGSGLLRGDLMAALDGSKLPTTQTYQGCGKLKETKKVKVKGQKEPAIQEIYVYGWKVLVLIDVQTRLPLAMKVVPIQEYEGRWLLPLLEQAQANLGMGAKITKVVIDRGYLDGEDLWEVHQRGIIFVIVAKAGMVVAVDAQAIARDGPVSVRETTVTHGHGKNAHQEIVRTKLVGISNLTTYDAYGDPEHTAKSNRRDYQGRPINAVVVQLWNNRAPSTDGIVYLTNGSVEDPFVVFDD
jgi:Transposase DDE domain